VIAVAVGRAGISVIRLVGEGIAPALGVREAQRVAVERRATVVDELIARNAQVLNIWRGFGPRSSRNPVDGRQGRAGLHLFLLFFQRSEFVSLSELALSFLGTGRDLVLLGHVLNKVVCRSECVDSMITREVRGTIVKAPYI